MNMRWLGQINSLPPSVGGGTFSKQNYTMLDNLFQSPHKGWDIRLLGDSGALYEFQSTHPQGVGRSKARSQNLSPCISIHPPARGGTLLELSAAAIASVFQSTHPQGVGPRASAISWRPQYFNPPTRKGWDAKGSTGSTTSTYFNPPTRKGWDRRIHPDREAAR